MSWRSRHGSFASLVKLAAIITAVFSLTTLFGEKHRLLELFSHFRFQYLAIALLLTVLLLFTRNRGWAGLLFLVVLINAASVAPWYFPVEDSPRNPNPGFKILHANVYADNDDPDKLIELIAVEQPDVVFLQEINDRWMAYLDTLSETYPHRYAEPRTDKFGIAMFAREPPLAIKTFAGPPSAYPTLVLQMNVVGTPVTLVSTHPPPPIGRDGIAARNKQLSILAGLITEIDGAKVVIGDLNTSMFSHQYAVFRAKTGLVDARRGFGMVPTWPAQLPIAMIPIDLCLVTEDIAVVGIKSGRNIGSDHLPLIVTLTPL